MRDLSAATPGQELEWAFGRDLVPARALQKPVFCRLSIVRIPSAFRHCLIRHAYSAATFAPSPILDAASSTALTMLW